MITSKGMLVNNQSPFAAQN